MPIMDAQLLFSESQSIAGNAGTSTESTNIVYIPKVLDHLGASQNDRYFVNHNLFLNVVVEDTALLAAVDGCVLTIALYADTDATTVTTDGDIILTKNFTCNTPADQGDGYVLMSVPLPVETMKPYLAVKYTKATQNLSAGAVTAWIGTSIQQGGEHGNL